MAITDITLLQTAVVQPGEIAGYSCAGTGSTKYGRYYYFGSVAGRVEEKKGMQKVVVNNKFIGWFLFTNGGNNYQNAWSGSRYFLPDGRMASGVTKVSDKYYFFQRSSTTQYRGQMYKGTWIKYNNKYYYAASNGILRSILDGEESDVTVQMYYFYFNNCVAQTNRSATRAGHQGMAGQQRKIYNRMGNHRFKQKPGTLYQPGNR